MLRRLINCRIIIIIIIIILCTHLGLLCQCSTRIVELLSKETLTAVRCHGVAFEFFDVAEIPNVNLLTRFT